MSMKAQLQQSSIEALHRFASALVSTRMIRAEMLDGSKTISYTFFMHTAVFACILTITCHSLIACISLALFPEVRTMHDDTFRSR